MRLYEENLGKMSKEGEIDQLKGRGEALINGGAMSQLRSCCELQYTTLYVNYRV